MNGTTRYNGERLTATLEAQGRKARWLAKEVGVSESLISKIAKGERTADGGLAERVSKVLGVPFSLLFEIQEKNDLITTEEAA